MNQESEDKSMKPSFILSVIFYNMSSETRLPVFKPDLYSLQALQRWANHLSSVPLFLLPLNEHRKVKKK